MSKQPRSELLFLDTLNSKFYRMHLRNRQEIDSFWSWYNNLKKQRKEQQPRR